MTTRQKALAAGSPTLGMLLVVLAWNVITYRRERHDFTR